MGISTKAATPMFFLKWTWNILWKDLPKNWKISLIQWKWRITKMLLNNFFETQTVLACFPRSLLIQLLKYRNVCIQLCLRKLCQPIYATTTNQNALLSRQPLPKMADQQRATIFYSDETKIVGVNAKFSKYLFWDIH